MKKLLIVMFAVLACSFVLAQTNSGRTSPQTSSAVEQGTQVIINGPVAEYITDTSATIGWATRTPATMGVKYGTSPAHLTETAAAVAGTDARNNHARLEKLAPNTRYYFQVTDNGEPVGGIGTFLTVGRGATPVKSKAIIPQ